MSNVGDFQRRIAAAIAAQPAGSLLEGRRLLQGGTNSPAKPAFEGELTVYESPHARGVLLVDRAVKDRYDVLTWHAVQHDSAEYAGAIERFRELRRYKAGEKYHQVIPEVKYLPVSVIKRQEMDFRPEVMTVSDEVARNMDYSEPVEVTAFRFGDDDTDTQPVVTLRDGHHRTAAALQTGRPYLAVRLQAINAKGEKLAALIGMSHAIETVLRSEAAEALGFQSPQDMAESLAQKDVQDRRNARSVEYQASPEATARKQAHAATWGISPNDIAWVQPPETTPPWLQSFEEFRDNAFVINVHRGEDGKFTLGRALGDQMESEQQQRSLMHEFDRRSPQHANALMDQFRHQLAETANMADVVLLSGHTVGGKHFLLNTLLVTPRDIFERAYDASIAEVAARGEPVYVPATNEDPREKLLAEREAAEPPRSRPRM